MILSIFLYLFCKDYYKSCQCVLLFFLARPPAAAPDASTIHQSASNPLPLSQLLHTPARQLSAPQAAPRNIGAQRSAAFPTVLEDRGILTRAIFLPKATFSTVFSFFR